MAMQQQAEKVAGWEELRNQVVAEMDEEGLSQADVAKEAGVSTSQVNGFVRGNYTGDLEAAGTRMAQWLKQRKERKTLAQCMPTGPGWVATPTAKRIMACLLFAHHRGVLGMVYGGAGLGKTETAKHYALEARNVWMVTMRPSCKKLGALLNELCLSLGIKPETPWPAHIERQIIGKLKNTKGLLIVDEANHLDLEGLDTLRSLQDATGAGMILMGNEEVYSRITGGARKAHLAQLFSRIRKCVRLHLPAEGDVEALAEAWGVTGKQETLYLRGVARSRGQLSEGALRNVDSALDLAATYAGGVPITLAHLKTAWNELGGDA